MEFVFDEKRAAQAAAYLLRLHGAPMAATKLAQLLYLADRRAFVEVGYPMTGDRFVATPHGLAPGRILDLLTWGCRDEDTPWAAHVSPPSGYCVTAKGSPAKEALSEYDGELLAVVLEEFGGMEQWELADYTRTLAEWVEPEGRGCTAAVDPLVILREAGYAEDEIAEAKQLASSIHSVQTQYGMDSGPRE